MTGHPQRTGWDGARAHVARLGPYVILALLPFGVFSWVMKDAILTDANDGLLFNYPLRIIAGNMLAAGQLPLWNPYSFGGSPFFAALQAGQLYPVNWLFAVMPPVIAMNLATILSYSLAATGTYALAREIGCNVFGAVIAALAFAFGSSMICRTQHTNILNSAAWMPVVLYWLVRFRHCPSWGVLAAGAVSIAIQFFAGHGQIWLYTLLYILIYAAGTAFGRPTQMAPGRYFFSVLLMVGLGIALAAVQLLPAMELVKQSTKAAVDFGKVIHHSLPVEQLSMFLFPYLFGEPGAGSAYPYWGNSYFQELSGYVGIVPLMLACATVPWAARRRLLPFWILGSVGLLIAIRGFLPSKWLFHALPGFGAFPAMARGLLIVDLSLALLSGLALTYLARLPRDTASRLLRRGCMIVLSVMVGMVAVLAMGGELLNRLYDSPAPAWTFDVARPGLWVPLVLALLSGAVLFVWVHWPSGSGSRSAVLAVLVVDLLYFGMLSAKGVWPIPPPHKAEWMTALDRLAARDASPARMFHPHGNTVLVGNLPGAFGLDSLGGYEGLLFTRYSKLMGDLMEDGRVGDAVLFAGHRGLDLLNGKYLVLFHGDPRARLPPSWFGLPPDRWRLAWDEHGVAIYENLRVLPRAWMVFIAEQVTGPQALDIVRTGAWPDGRLFDPRGVALVEEHIARALGPSDPLSSVRSIRSGPNVLEFVTRSATNALLVLSEIDYPGWACEVDGEAVTTVRVDYLLRGVPVVSGERRVVCRYAPLSIRGGALLSALSVAVLLGGWYWTRVRRVLP